MLHFPQNQMIMYSTHGFGDIGSREACENNQNFGLNTNEKNSYMLFNLNVSTTPVIMRFGLCLPSVCKQNEINKVFEDVSNKLSAGLQGLV